MATSIVLMLILTPLCLLGAWASAMMIVWCVQVLKDPSMRGEAVILLTFLWLGCVAVVLCLAVPVMLWRKALGLT